MQGANGVLQYHNHSVQQALVDLFPAIEFDKSKYISTCMSKFVFGCTTFCFLTTSLKNYITATSWQDLRDRKKFFEEYAEANGFDPHNPENWYTQTANKIKSSKVFSNLFIHFLYFCLFVCLFLI